MAGFVKLHTSMLRSTIWFARPDREVFITALLLAEPREFRSPVPQLHADRLEPTGWDVPPGWYGFCETSGPGLLRLAGVPDPEGFEALARLGSPEPESRSSAFDGRRLVRVDGGYVALNYDRYRAKDTTVAERSRRYRERKRADAADVSPRRGATASHRGEIAKHRSATQAEAEAEAEAEVRGGAGEHAPLSLTASTPPAKRVNSKPIKIQQDWKPSDRQVQVLATKHGVTIERVAAEVPEFVWYWSDGGGSGKLRSGKGWEQAFGNRVDEQAKRGVLFAAADMRANGRRRPTDVLLDKLQAEIEAETAKESDNVPY